MQETKTTTIIFKNWNQVNQDEDGYIRAGWIRRTDGHVGYVNLDNQDFTIRGDFMLIGGVHKRTWVAYHRRNRIRAIPPCSSVENVMMELEDRIERNDFH